MISRATFSPRVEIDLLPQQALRSSICEDESAPAQPVTALAHQIRSLVDEVIIPNELVLGERDDSAARKFSQLAGQARAAGLWGLFYPVSLGGQIASLEDYLLVAEQEGRSEYGPAIFGSEATLDVHMLDKHGNEEIRDQFLKPMITGDFIPSYAMSEPDSIGSNPLTIKTSATLADGVWTLNGRKWFVCRADRAAFVTVVAKTDPEAALDRALSMILVPTHSPGFKIERQLDIFGRFQGQCEISFTDVKVPARYLLGERNQGHALMHRRLGLGRILRSIHWIGLAQRCLDLMCARICSDRGDTARLQDKQLVRLRVFEAHRAIAAARALIRAAARGIDAQRPSDIDIMTAKVASSEALSKASDSAIQIFGAEGVSNLTPLSDLYRTARATHIMDGADDVLISAVGRRILDSYAGHRA